MNEHKYMIDISKDLEMNAPLTESINDEDLHEELVNFTQDNFDWYDLTDDCDYSGELTDCVDQVHAWLEEKSDDELVDAINQAIEEDYWDREPTVADAAKKIVDKYLDSRGGSEEFDAMMDYPMDDIDNLTEAKDCSRSFGYVMSKHMDLLGKIKNKEQLLAFVKELCEPEVNDLDQKMYLEGLLSDITRQSFTKGLEQVCNIILKGEGLGTIPSRSRRRYESLNWKDIEVSPTDYDCHIESLKEQGNAKIVNPKTWSLRNDSAYFKTQTATSAYGKHLKDK